MNLNNLITKMNRMSKFDYRYVKKLLLSYKCNDWKKYQLFTNTYCKNLVYKNNLFDIYLLSWNKNSLSKIHDHSDNGCLMKILEGELYETLYDKNIINFKNNIYQKNDISYINNSIGYHSIQNIYHKSSYSLHIYSPPNYKTNYFN